MCEYCSTDSTFAEETKDYGEIGIDLVREGGRWTIEAYGFDGDGYCIGGTSVEIRFCPMCGRRLSE